MTKTPDELGDEIVGLIASRSNSPTLANLPQFLIYNNQNVTIHYHHHTKEGEHAIIESDRKRHPEPVE